MSTQRKPMTRQYHHQYHLLSLPVLAAAYNGYVESLLPNVAGNASRMEKAAASDAAQRSNISAKEDALQLRAVEEAKAKPKRMGVFQLTRCVGMLRTCFCTA
jgi:hypothetical protein